MPKSTEVDIALLHGMMRVVEIGVVRDRGLQRSSTKGGVLSRDLAEIIDQHRESLRFMVSSTSDMFCDFGRRISAQAVHGVVNGLLRYIFHNTFLF